MVNHTECCRRNNVSSHCLDICSFSLDFDTLRRKPHCLPEFDRLMSCASDGSDHRHCCANAGVPPRCLNWCRGQVVPDTEVCAASHARTIVGCFHEGASALPGPPRNLAARPVDASSVLVTWDVPDKNPGSVELYRVFWRPVDGVRAEKNDTSDTRLVIAGLEPGTSYEVT